MPRLPGDEPQRTKTSFQQYAISFQPLKKVVWSVVGSGGKGGMAELDPFLPLANEFSNLHGIYLDDFIIDRKKREDGRVVGRPALSPDELESARSRLKAVGRPQEIWVTLYSHELAPDHPRFIGCDPALSEFLHLFDVLTLWTWNSDELTNLDASLAALEAAARPRLHVFLSTSPLHREHKLRMTRQQVLDRVVESVAYAKRHIDDIEFSTEDGTRTERDFLAEVTGAAIAAGATTINVPDTLGYTTPDEMRELFRFLIDTVPGAREVVFSAHCHDDLGMAVANSLAAIEGAWAVRVHEVRASVDIQVGEMRRLLHLVHAYFVDRAAARRP